MQNKLQLLLLAFILNCSCNSNNHKNSELLLAQKSSKNISQNESFESFRLFSDTTYEYVNDSGDKFGHQVIEKYFGKCQLKKDTILFTDNIHQVFNSKGIIIRKNYIEFLEGQFEYKLKNVRLNIKYPIEDDSIEIPNYSIFMYNPKEVWGNLKDMKPYKLSKKHIKEIDIMIKKFILSHPNEIKFAYAKYYKQLIPCIDTNNRTVHVFVNLTCEENISKENFQNYIISARDGGSCFVKIVLDLSNKKITQFWVNGDA